MVRTALALTLLLLLVPMGAAARPAASTTLRSFDWPGYDRDGSDMRYAPTSAITPATAGHLRLAWTFHTGIVSPKTSFEATPVVAGGRLFIAAPNDTVFALDPRSGRLLWRFAPTLAADTRPSLLTRGVAYGDGQVFLATLDDRLIALDAATGRQRWQFILQNPALGYFESMAPLFDRGRVIVGTSGSDSDIRGFVAAFDARSGRELWLFDTIPSPAEPGGNTWPNNGAYHFGGAAAWMTPAVDPKLNLIYVTVGNPSPVFNGARRAGENLYANSIVALQATTGQVVWYWQEVHHDLWDLDAASPAVLFTMHQGKNQIPAVMEVGKTGFVYVLDRRTGRPLVATPERPVPGGVAWQHSWPTQPEPQNQPVAPLCPAPGLYSRQGCIFTPTSDTPTLIAPGGIGGSAWSPVSYSPRTGLAYIAANTYPMIRQTTPTSCCYQKPPVRVSTVQFSGALLGYDVARGRIAWRVSLPPPALAFGGSSVTSGNVIIHGESAGYVDARDATNGKLLWRYRTGAGADAAPAIYSVGATTYVAIAAGGNEVIGSPRGDTLFVFALRYG
ncbi:MAG TPA: PQQ-binding-like beta-propeller repeat protein [Chloroflexota bacterium]|nr:PQQ-binding-like beta-propeller repeat protein [Chloroflexota bacterium]